MGILDAFATKLLHAEARLCKKGCYRAYTHLFAPFALLVLGALLVAKRGLIWSVDGLSQYYLFFVYEGQWLHDIVSNLLSGNGIQIPLWEWTCGYGADIPTTFDVFLDPLNLVSAVTPESLSEWVFQLLVVIRLWLAGLAFICYAQTRGENRTGTVLGALLYALGGSGLTVVRWSSGLHALILFPVVLAGAERILAGKKPWTFVWSLALLAIVSYYFTYMVCIMLVGYLTIRIVMLERPGLTPRRFLRWVGVFGSLVLLCFLLAGFALVPAAFGVLGMDRLTDHATSVSPFYTFERYVKILSGFLSVADVGADTEQGFGGLAFIACLVLLGGQKEKNRELKAILLTLTAFLFIPAVGSFLNVMNYAANRWAWAYALCVSFVLCRTTPELLHMSARPWRTIVLGVCVYALAFAMPLFRSEANVAGFAALLATIPLLMRMHGTRMDRVLLCAALACTLGVNGFYFLAADENGIGNGQLELASAYARLTTNSVDSIAQDANDDTWWRYDAAQSFYNSPRPVNRVRNNPLVLGLNGISFYNSVYSADVDAFHTELGVVGDYMNFSYTDLQGRSDLMSLLGVKYYAYRKDGSDAVPYGFSKDREVAQRTIGDYDYRLLESDSYLPFGCTFDKVITREDYLSLTPTQRQQALLQAVVLDSDTDADVTFAKATDLDFEDQSIPYTIAQTNGVTIDGNTLDVANGGATIKLEFEGTPEADTFVLIRGLKYRTKMPSDYYPTDVKEQMTIIGKVSLFVRDLTTIYPYIYTIRANSNVSNMSAYIENILPSIHLFGGKDTWVAELGYAEDAAHSITLTFVDRGIYTYDSIEVITQTHKNRSSWVEARTSATLQGLELGTNTLTGSIDVDEPRMLFLPVAYSKGWSATVDGQSAEVWEADTAFMALSLDAGHHDIELCYHTPGLSAGLVVSGVGIVALVLLAVVVRRRS